MRGAFVGRVGAMTFAAIVAAQPSCRSSDVFACSAKDECVQAGIPGTCEETGYCSFPDDRCPSERRYGQLASDELRGTCVVEACTSECDSDGLSPLTTGADSSATGATTLPSGDDAQSTGEVAASSSDTAVDPSDSSSSTGLVTGDLPNGELCADGAECQSGLCFFVPPFGGRCSECLSDADCDGGGCSVPQPLANPPQGAACNDGGLGEGCMSTEVCQPDLVCTLILELPGVLTAQTCSECVDDEDCDGDELCSPTYDVLATSGAKVCVAPASVPDGQGCDYLGSGDQACASGACATVDVLTLVVLGVCGQCENDGDCVAPATCHAAQLDTNTGDVTPPYCE
jgi:hypothetical protein